MIIENGWKFYTPAEVAAAAGVSVRTIYRMIRSKRLVAQRAKPNTMFWISETDVKEAFGDRVSV